MIPLALAIDVPGSTVTIAAGINRKGRVVGYYTDSVGVNHGFIL